jgi:hypothetical protein
VVVGTINSTQANFQLGDQGMSLLAYTSSSSFTAGNLSASGAGGIPYGAQIDFGGGVSQYPVITQNINITTVPFIMPSGSTLTAGSPTAVLITNRLIIPPVASGTASSIVNFPVITEPINTPSTPSTGTTTFTTQFPPADVYTQPTAWAVAGSAGTTSSAWTAPGANETSPQILAGDVIYPYVIYAGGTAAANVTITLQVERI